MAVGANWARRIAVSLAVLATIITLGGVGLWLLTGGDFSLEETIYFALITVSTVGFGEPPELHNYPGSHAVVAVLIITGVGGIAFFESSLTAMLVEDSLGRAFRRRRMDKRIERLRGHVILAGCGRTGRFCAEELRGLGRQFVVIDNDEAMLKRLSEETFGGNLLYVNGDATDDHALIGAGVERAWGLVCALTEDRDNVFVALSARALAPKLRIVAKVLQPENEHKLRKAGVERFVSPHRIGGLRLVSELVRPKTMDFMDELQSMSGSDLHMEDVEIDVNSRLNGRALIDAQLPHSVNALIVALRHPNGRFIHNPPKSEVLRPGSHLIVVGDRAGVQALRDIAGDSSKDSGRT